MRKLQRRIGSRNWQKIGRVLLHVNSSVWMIVAATLGGRSALWTTITLTAACWLNFAFWIQWHAGLLVWHQFQIDMRKLSAPARAGVVARIYLHVLFLAALAYLMAWTVQRS